MERHGVKEGDVLPLLALGVAYPIVTSSHYCDSSTYERYQVRDNIHETSNTSILNNTRVVSVLYGGDNLRSTGNMTQLVTGGS